MPFRRVLTVGAHPSGLPGLAASCRGRGFTGARIDPAPGAWCDCRVIILRTERLLLRGWRAEDLDALAAMNADPEVKRRRVPAAERSQTFSAQSVNDLLRRQGLLRYPGRTGHPPDKRLGEHEWRLPDLAAALDMPHATLHTWAHRGWVHGHRDDTPQHA